MAGIDKPNHEKINYSLRPAKHVERKMLCDAFLKLSVLDRLDTYQYIGFGSAYFSDFSLVHKVLGIKYLTSIERDEDSEDRFLFNKPYSCITLKIGTSGQILPTLNWTYKSIIWLDYTEKLSNYMIDDIQTCIMSVRPGSVFLMSVNIDPDNGSISEKEKAAGVTINSKRLNSLKERIDPKFIPDIDENNLLGLVNNQEIIHEIINSSILSTLKLRNGGLKTEEKLEYKQIFNFYYKDNAGMLTIGGIIYEQTQVDKIKKMAFDNIFYVRNGNNPFKIIVPNLTYREIHALDILLPKLVDEHSGEIVRTEDNELFIPPISEDAIKEYANIYRYFPSFLEVNL